LNRTPISQEIIARMDKCDYTKLKGFCITKEAIARVNRQPAKLEKILAVIHPTGY
jgi:hypothetical protein